MTPEERARLAIADFGRSLPAAIAAQIHAAIAEEREACAQIAASRVRSFMTGSPHWDNQVDHTEHPSRDPAYQILTAIRARP